MSYMQRKEKKQPNQRSLSDEEQPRREVPDSLSPPPARHHHDSNENVGDVEAPKRHGGPDTDLSELEAPRRHSSAEERTSGNATGPPSKKKKKAVLELAPSRPPPPPLDSPSPPSHRAMPSEDRSTMSHASTYAARPGAFRAGGGFDDDDETAQSSLHQDTLPANQTVNQDILVTAEVVPVPEIAEVVETGMQNQLEAQEGPPVPTGFWSVRRKRYLLAATVLLPLVGATTVILAVLLRGDSPIPPTRTGSHWEQIGNDIHGGSAKEQFGYSVSLSSDGRILAAGMPFSKDPGRINAGQVTVYEFVDNDWTQMGDELAAEGPGDWFGRSVSLSGNGTVLAVGASHNDGNGMDAGHARVFHYQDGNWIQLGDDIDGVSPEDMCGQSISLSKDANRVAVGSFWADTPVGFDAGHVRVFELVADEWNQIGSTIKGEAAGDQSGFSVSLSTDGGVLAIGAYDNDAEGAASGHVRVYRFQGNDWRQVGSDIDGDYPYDESGIAVALSFDGNVVAIAAQKNDGVNGTDSGHVRVYQFAGDWSQLGGDIDGEASEDESGRSIAMSADGTIVAVGAYLNDGNGTDAGHVRVYGLDGGDWLPIGMDIDGEAEGDESGYSVALSTDGRVLAVGARNNDGNGENAGHVRVYRLAD